jgi:osmotically-inducible protein OsmY
LILNIQTYRFLQRSIRRYWQSCDPPHDAGRQQAQRQPYFVRAEAMWKPGPATRLATLGKTTRNASRPGLEWSVSSAGAADFAILKGAFPDAVGWLNRESSSTPMPRNLSGKFVSISKERHLCRDGYDARMRRSVKMTRTMRTTRTALVTATLAGTLWGLSQGFMAIAQTPAQPAAQTPAQPAAQTPAQPPASAATAQTANPEDSAAEARLDKKQFHDVKVTVDQGIATLTGTVDLYAYKADADKRVRKVKGVTAVHNLIQVGGPTIPDEVLEDKLGEKLEYDRVFYGNAFNAISISVHNGVVTLGNHALSYVSRDSALALVSYYPGVKGVEDEIQVDPVSLFDNRIRMQVYRAVYGFPTLNKYAIDPGKPIRISVQNGHVGLYGTVDSKADRDVAFIRANSVFGVFKVENFLNVAPPPPPKKKKVDVETGK